LKEGKDPLTFPQNFKDSIMHDECPHCGNKHTNERDCTPDDKNIMSQLKALAESGVDVEDKLDEVIEYYRKQNPIRVTKPRLSRLLDLHERCIRVQTRLLNWLLIHNEDKTRLRISTLWTRIYNIEDAIEKRDKLYDELIFAVGKIYPNETRHETALRYIREAEKDTNQTGAVTS
jgi:hypothetical protein